MTKFFRRIRQRLLSENKFTKYLLYAVGEIVLVVIGILIALQINNWNEDRKNRQIEKYYLGQIMVDLNDDVQTLQNEKERFLAQLPIIANFLDVVDDEKPDMKTFNSALLDYLHAAWYVMRFNPNSVTFEEMKSSGKLGLIKNNNLRNSIVVLYRDLSSLEKMFKSNNEFLTPHAMDLNFNKGMAVFIKDQSSMFSKFNSDEALYEKLKYKEDFISNAANQHWSIAEISPAIDIQLIEIQKVLGEIKNYIQTEKAVD